MTLFDVYPLFPINIVRGQGCRVWDANDTEYLDLYGGHAVISIGHAHPHYVEAVSQQVAKLGFYSNSVVNTLQQQLAERLGQACGYEDYQLFLINSGAEANENALKLASFTNGRTRVLSCEKAFHGRTSLAVEVTNNPKIIAPINDNGHVTYLPLNDTEAWLTEIQKGDVCAVILECIQGVGGIRMVEPAFYRAIREACTKYGTLLICDEIQCGYGRSGKFFAHQWLLSEDSQSSPNTPSSPSTPSSPITPNSLRPDIITVAKGIANGFPMAAVLISPALKPVYGQLGTTFGGNHLACAAALAVLDVMQSEQLVDNARRVGDHLMAGLKQLQRELEVSEPRSLEASNNRSPEASKPRIAEVRGRGLMIGIELTEPYKEIRSKLLFEEHVFTGCAGTHTLRLLPPLCLSMEQADEFLSKLRKVLL